MYESVRPGESEKGKRAKFQERLNTQADVELLTYVESENGQYFIEKREISESLEEVVHACGAALIRASVGFIGLPDEVIKAANQADAQPYQFATQVASAEAAKRARTILQPTAEEMADPTFADRQAFAASSDPDSRVEVIHVSGGSGGGDALGIKQAAAIVASALKKGGKR